MSLHPLTGLCQAKIVAAELWRKYSENYKGHQARYPNPKSRYRPRRSDNGHISPLTEGSIKSEEDLWSPDGFEEGDGCEGEDEWCGSRCHSNEDSPPAFKTDRDGPDLPLTEPLLKIPLASNNNNLSLPNHCPSTPHTVSEQLPLVIAPRTLSSPATSEAVMSGLQASSLAILTSSALSALHQACPTMAPAPNVSPSPLAPGQLGPPPGSPQLTSPSPSEDGRNPKTPFRPGEYKKSERGLSYLFPSLSDQQLSLLDKVRITVLRHKNNYFLDWTPTELAQVAPIVRPKMVVTRDLYKEYCHRNAMKYDSNLQFAMEAPEPWAEEFRLRLSCPPSEGGFHSLCEVKQEAGRLWREYSGKYKMHNVVKAQMDRNSEAAQSSRIEAKIKGKRPLEQQRSAKDVQAALEELYRAGYATGSVVAAEGLLPACPSPALPRPTSLGPSPSLSPSSTATEASNDESGRKRRLDEPNKDEEYKSARLDSHIPSSPWGSAVSPPGSDTLRSEVQPREAMSAALRAASELFPALPPGLRVSQQVAVWLERHQQAYFLSVPLESLSPLFPPHVRPRLTVTETLYQRFMSPLASHLHQLMLVMASHKPAAVAFQKCVSVDQYDSLEAVLLEAMEVWNKHVSADHAVTELPLPTQNKLAVKSDPATTPSLAPSVLSVPEVKPAVSHSGEASGPLSDTSVRSSKAGAMPPLLKVQLPRRAPAPSHPAPTPSNDLSHDVLDLSMSSSSQPPAPTAPSVPAPPSTTLHQLWSLRGLLQTACRDDPAKSLHTRLREYTGLLRQQLGDDYQLPSNQSDCLVDLMLASVHKHLTQTWVTSTCWPVHPTPRPHMTPTLPTVSSLQKNVNSNQLGLSQYKDVVLPL